LSPAGKMVDAWWMKLPQKFPRVTLDAHVPMPDHVHGILLLDVTAADGAAHPKVAVSRVVQWFKTMSTNEYIRRVNTNGWRRFDRRLWQRGFYDHVIRDEQSLLKIREYIEHNPGALFELIEGRTRGSAPTLQNQRSKLHAV